jgi:hypothetical protein
MSTGVANVLRRVIAGRTLKFEFDPPQMQYMDSFQAVGGKIWPASDLMLKYFEATSFVKDKSVLELGSGCGLVGIGCAVLGARSVTLTDRTITQRRMIYDAEGMLVDQELPPNRILLDLCEQNIANNAAVTENCSFDVAELEWGSANQRHLDKLFVPTGTGTDSEQKPFDLIVGSDVTYHSNISEQLFWTVSQLLRRQRHSPLQASQHLKNTLSTNNTSSSSINSRTNNLTAATVEAHPLRFVAAHQHRLRTATANCLIAAQEAGLKCRVLAANYDPNENSGSRSSRRSSGGVISKDDGHSGLPFDENTMIMLPEVDASSGGAASETGKEPPKLLIWEFTPI